MLRLADGGETFEARSLRMRRWRLQFCVAAARPNRKPGIFLKTVIGERKLALQERRGPVRSDSPGVGAVATQPQARRVAAFLLDRGHTSRRNPIAHSLKSLAAPTLPP